MALDHSFVVLAYGQSPFLPGCLKSLLQQTVQSRILITTSTPSRFVDQVAAEYRVPVQVNPERAGIAADWNFGLCATAARHVTLAHQDDVYAPKFLARTQLLFERYAGTLCFTGYDEVDDLGRPISSKISSVKHLLERLTIGQREAVNGKRLKMFLSFGNPLPCSSVTFDRKRLPDFKFSADYASNLDWDAWWRLCERGETFLHAPDRLVGRRHNPLTETSRLIASGCRQKEDLMMFRRLWPRPLADVVAFAYRASY
jgi:hypothetical protein